MTSSQDASSGVRQAVGAGYLAPRNRFLQALAVTVAILIDPFPKCQLVSGARSSEFGLAQPNAGNQGMSLTRKTEFRRPGTFDGLISWR